MLSFHFLHAKFYPNWCRVRYETTKRKILPNVLIKFRNRNAIHGRIRCTIFLKFLLRSKFKSYFINTTLPKPAIEENVVERYCEILEQKVTHLVG